MSIDVYTVYDEVNNTEVAFAPIVLQVRADALEDILRFVAREEFRKVEILEPEQVVLGKHDLERILFRLNEELKDFRRMLERKYNTR